MVWRIIRVYLLQAKYLTMVAEIMASHIPAVFLPRPAWGMQGKCRVQKKLQGVSSVMPMSTASDRGHADFLSDKAAVLTEMILYL